MLTDMTEKIVSPFIDETSQTGGTGQRRSRSVETLEGRGSGRPVHEDRVVPLVEMGVFHNDVCPYLSCKRDVWLFLFLRGVEAGLSVLPRLAWKGVTKIHTMTGGFPVLVLHPVLSLGAFARGSTHHRTLTSWAQAVLAPHTAKRKYH